MHPFNGTTAMVRNRWYIAAFAHEITREPIERTILGKPVAMYRTLGGQAVAMYGLCPHRYYPLALGKLEGDAIVCGYHGFTFAANGKCIKIPSQGTGSGFSQPTYRIEERGILCWIWMGDEDKCDPAMIPPYDDFGLDCSGWRTSSLNYHHLKGRHSLLVDNLMDLTHLPYIHSHMEGGDSLKKNKLVETERERSYQLNRLGAFAWSSVHSLMWGEENRYEGEAEFNNITEFYGPELIRTGMPIFTKVEGHDEVPPALGKFFILHGITPETETTTHYFGFATRNFRLQDEGLDNVWLEADKHIRRQDIDAIEAVEMRMEAAVAAQRELLVQSDGPAVKVRQKIQALLDLEA